VNILGVKAWKAIQTAEAVDDALQAEVDQQNVQTLQEWPKDLCLHEGLSKFDWMHVDVEWHPLQAKLLSQPTKP